MRGPQTQNTSQLTVTQPLHDLAAIRDEVCSRANIHDLAQRAGFRPDLRRRGWFGCIHGQDRTPSAHAHKGRIVCFGCDRSWSPVDLVMLSDGVAYVPALKTLASETGVQFDELSPREAERLRGNRDAAKLLAIAIMDWSHGLSLQMENRKDDLIKALNWALDNNAPAMARDMELRLMAIPQWAISPESSDPRVIASAYCNAVNQDPEQTARTRETGRRGRKIYTGVIDIFMGLLSKKTDLRRVAA